MNTKKQPGPTLRNLLSAAIACLILAIGCASPTTELTVTNTPTIAAATAIPTSATADAPPETPTPTSIPVAMEITEDASDQETQAELTEAKKEFTKQLSFNLVRVFNKSYFASESDTQANLKALSNILINIDNPTITNLFGGNANQPNLDIYLSSFELAVLKQNPAEEINIEQEAQRIIQEKLAPQIMAEVFKDIDANSFYLTSFTINDGSYQIPVTATEDMGVNESYNQEAVLAYTQKMYDAHPELAARLGEDVIIYWEIATQNTYQPGDFMLTANSWSQELVKPRAIRTYSVPHFTKLIASVSNGSLTRMFNIGGAVPYLAYTDEAGTLYMALTFSAQTDGKNEMIYESQMMFWPMNAPEDFTGLILPGVGQTISLNNDAKQRIIYKRRSETTTMILEVFGDITTMPELKK